jgi:hypothetical protein
MINRKPCGKPLLCFYQLPDSYSSKIFQMFYVVFFEYQAPEHVQLCQQLWEANTKEALCDYIKIQPRIKSESFKNQKLAKEFISGLPATRVFYSLADHHGVYYIRSQKCKQDEALFRPGNRTVVMANGRIKCAGGMQLG